MTRITLLVSLLSVVGTAHAVSWTDLWLTQEQQAQHLLDSGNAAGAAHEFVDPRRRAYAEIEAGKYAEAAQLLERFRDPQSQYNRGNALARAGRLDSALAAYDEAIKQTTLQSPLGQDARRNRELVAEQLEKQQSSRPTPDDKSQAGQQASETEQSAKQDQSQSGNRSKQGRQDQTPSGQQGQSDVDNKDEQRERDRQHAGKGSGEKQNQSTHGSQDQQSRPGEAQESGDSQRSATTSGTRTQDQDAARSQRDAAMARPESNNDEATNGRTMQAESSTDRSGTSVAATQELRPSERTLALDQWLRQIPDDPAGLLRRKFLIEHLRRQGSQEELQ